MKVEEIYKEKNHTFFKVMLPVMAFIYVLAVSLLCGLMSGEKFSVTRELLSDLCALVLNGILILFFLKVIFRIFPYTREYSLKKVGVDVVLIVISIVMIMFILKYRLLYRFMAFMGDAELLPVNYSLSELKEDLVYSISSVFLAPVLEEMCFRVIPISVCKKRVSRVVMLVIGAFLFGILHSRNMFACMFDAVSFGLIFMISKNALLPIIAHSILNLITTMLMVISYFALTSILMSENGPAVLLLSPVVNIVILVISIGVIIEMLLWRKKKQNV